MKLITQYIIALSNLYGVVHRAKVMEIYNNQNKDKIKLSDIRGIVDNEESDLEKGYVEVYNEYFYNIGIEEIFELLEEKGQKPYYIPPKEELLKYVDDFYFEKNKEYEALVGFVEKHLIKSTPIKAQNLCFDIQGAVQFGGNIRNVIDLLDNNDVDFKNDKLINEFIQVVLNLINNTRIWENNGYTPIELYEIYSKEKQGAALRH